MTDQSITDHLGAPYAPVPVTDVELAFPAPVRHLMPASVITADAPQTWRDFQRAWFFHGLPADVQIHVRDGIDGETAYRHLCAIQGTFECKHEHKEAAVAFLAARWFVRAVVPAAGVVPERVYGEPVATEGAA